eukprot:Amastigsp_a177469_16.p5 type:complete len:107 gc:universal Amastigsp_a177469_16:773-453(-)
MPRGRALGCQHVLVCACAYREPPRGRDHLGLCLAEHSPLRHRQHPRRNALPSAAPVSWPRRRRKVPSQIRLTSASIKSEPSRVQKREIALTRAHERGLDAAQRAPR